MRTLLAASLLSVLVLACSSDDASDGDGSTAGKGGSGQSGASGKAGASGKGGSTAGGGQGGSAQGGSSGASGQTGAGQGGSSQAGSGGSGGSAGSGGNGGSAAGQGGSTTAGQGGSPQAGSGGSTQAGSGGSSGGSGGSSQAGSGGSSQAGSGGSAQAGSGGSQAGQGGSSAGGSAQAGQGGSSGGSGQAGSGQAGAVSQGFVGTSGAKLVDHTGKVVRLTGVNWFGMETSNFAPHGLWARSLSSMMEQIASLGFNSVRVPFSSEMLDQGKTPNGIDFGQNAALQGKTPLEILDAVVAEAKKNGLRVILDRHRPGSGGQSELWYTDQYPEKRWIDDWKMLAKRYAGDPTVLGADLHNEPHGPATWGDGNAATDWRAAAERAGDAIHQENPDWLIIVEGIEKADGASYWWGGNLRRADEAPVKLTKPGRLVYSIHDYPPSLYGQSWFSDPAYPANLPSVWDETWGFLVKSSSAPVWLGEFGTKLENPKDTPWLDTLAGYIQENGLSFAFWCMNPNSGDTGGILQDDWKTVHQNKMDKIKPLLAPKL